MWFRAYLRNFTISKTTISDDSDTGSETEVEEEEECENLRKIDKYNACFVLMILTSFIGFYIWR